MLAALDVHYAALHAVAACVLFERWEDPSPVRCLTRRIERVEPYVPGAFYRRELPCLLAVLEGVEEPLEAIIVDGHVWLDAHGRPGLGAWLFDALAGRVSVVGVAKGPFRGSTWAVPVLRGRSTRALFVTHVGDVVQPAERVRRMHGPGRIPTLLKLADELCRRACAEASPPVATLSAHGTSYARSS